MPVEEYRYWVSLVSPVRSCVLWLDVLLFEGSMVLPEHVVRGQERANEIAGAENQIYSHGIF